MRSIIELRDTFTAQQYPPKEGKNYSEVPIANILSFLHENFGEGGFAYEVTSAGSLANGNNYVTLKLTVKLDTGTVTVAGAADAPLVGISGLTILALKNAVLRGLNTTDFYDNEDQPFVPSTPAPQQQAMPSQAAPYTAPSNGSGYSSYQQPQPQATNYGPWTGIGRNGQPITIKSGQLAGQAWINLDPQVLNQMASKGNNMAQMELQRRTGMQPAAASPNNYGGAGFPPNAFTHS